jgi:branched-chain amino acid transport system permease protein
MEENKVVRKRIPMPLRYGINTVLLLVLFGVISFFVNNVFTTYYVKVLTLVGINIILTVSLNVATGYLGQLPLGHAGFMAVGAYACALFTKYTKDVLPAGVSFALGLLLAGVIAGLFGVLIGIPALRLTGDYLSILTLGFGEIIRITLNNIDGVLGFKLFYGAAGLKNIPKYTNYINVFVCVVLACFVIHTIMKSRHGRAILSIRENEIAAESCGIETTYYKVLGFTLSAFFAGVAGGLYAGYLGVLSPSNFGFMKSIEILVMVVLGGMGSMLGSVASATVLTILPEALRQFADYRMVVYSLLLILIMIFKPGGLLGSYDFSMSRTLEHLINRDFRCAKREEKAAEQERGEQNV